MLRTIDAEQEGSLGPYCWGESQGTGHGEHGLDTLGVSFPKVPLTVSAGEPVTVDFRALGKPQNISVVAFDYDEASRRGKIVQGVFIQPCATPGGTEDGCVVERYDNRTGNVVNADLRLPRGRYIIVVSSEHRSSSGVGFVKQGFHLIVD